MSLDELHDAKRNAFSRSAPTRECLSQFERDMPFPSLSGDRGSASHGTELRVRRALVESVTALAVEIEGQGFRRAAAMLLETADAISRALISECCSIRS